MYYERHTPPPPPPPLLLTLHMVLKCLSLHEQGTSHAPTNMYMHIRTGIGG